MQSSVKKGQRKEGDGRIIVGCDGRVVAGDCAILLFIGTENGHILHVSTVGLDKASYAKQTWQKSAISLIA